MKKAITILLVILLVVLIVINIRSINKITICKKNIETDYYKEDITIKLKRFNEIKIIKNYAFVNQDILDKEKENLNNEDYDIKVYNLNIKAIKFDKLTDYYKIIKDYKVLGFTCN